MEQGKYPNLKRTLGVLTSPIIGSLSPKVRERIFGRKADCDERVPIYHKTHWTERLAGIASIVVNLGAGIYLSESPSDYPFTLLGGYGIFKVGESLYRSIDQMLFGILGDEQKSYVGSLEGTLISKAFIEPFLKDKKRGEK